MPGPVPDEGDPTQARAVTLLSPVVDTSRRRRHRPHLSPLETKPQRFLGCGTYDSAPEARFPAILGRLPRQPSRDREVATYMVDVDTALDEAGLTNPKVREY